MPAEVPYAEDSATATSPEASLSADISLPQSTASSSASGHEKLLRSFSPANVPHNLRPNTLNATKDMYWFAHMGETAQGNGSEGEGSPVSHVNYDDPSGASAALNAEAGASKTSPGARGLQSPGHSESKEESLANAQRDHEMRLRHYKELQEEERVRKLTELQMAAQQAQRFREQQEEDRRRKIDELRSKDLERRNAVEERKRLIWEAEQERKEAILRRNLERDAKIEAKRNAQRNTMSIAFGSSTPRDIDLPTGTVMSASRGSTFGSMVVLSTASQPPYDWYKKRTPSADVLDKDSDQPPSASENPMQTWDSESPSSQYNRRSFAGMSSEATRACLTIPENPIPSFHSYSSLQASSTTTTTTDSCDSFTDVWLFGSGVSDPMTRSLVILSNNRGRRRTDLTPTIPWERESALRSSSPGTMTGTRSQGAKRAVSMSRLDILAQPRRRPSAHLDHAGIPAQPANSSKGLHKDLHSPSRPRSSQSMASEQSVASTVSMRSQSGPRRVRPFSIAGSIIPINPEAGQVIHPLPPQRRSRTAERKVPVTPPTRPPRAKSSGPDAPAPGSTPKTTPVPPSRKPPVAPKATPKVEKVESEATEQQVPSTDNQEAMSGTEPSVEQQQQQEPPSSSVQVPSAPSKGSEEPKEGSPAATTGRTPRITSEEEAKAALAEKRRLAREQAEREAELERQRQEELRRQEEERIRLEEEEQRRMEEEQLRLAEELRKQEEEKLKKAIEEQQKKEEEEKARKEEENKLRIEKEELERKQREEAERQRKELEEKLRKEEVERAERKKRVEQIMKRTRTKNDSAPKLEETEKSTVFEVEAPAPGQVAQEPSVVTEEEKTEDSSPVPAKEEAAVVTEKTVLDKSEDVKVNGTSDVTEMKLTDTVQNGFQEELVNGIVGKTKIDSDAVSPQTNGYGSSHDVSLTEISPDDKSQQDVSPLLDFEGASNQEQWNQPPPPPTEFDQLIDLSLETTNQNELNRLNNADELNSNNRVPTIPFIAFEENVTRKQEASLTDLLS